MMKFAEFENNAPGFISELLLIIQNKNANKHKKEQDNLISGNWSQYILHTVLV